MLITKAPHTPSKSPECRFTTPNKKLNIATKIEASTGRREYASSRQVDLNDLLQGNFFKTPHSSKDFSGKKRSNSKPNQTLQVTPMNTPSRIPGRTPSRASLSSTPIKDSTSSSMMSSLSLFMSLMAMHPPQDTMRNACILTSIIHRLTGKHISADEVHTMYLRREKADVDRVFK